VFFIFIKMCLHQEKKVWNSSRLGIFIWWCKRFYHSQED